MQRRTAQSSIRSSFPLDAAAVADVSSQRVRVVRRHDEFAVVACVPFAVGQLVMSIEGPVVATPSRYSVQIGDGVHVDVSEAADRNHSDARYPWMSLNHACDPSAILRARTLVARRAIRVGEEVTFDYATTEWDMATPFDCRCGSARCRGRIAGYRHLTAEQRTAMGAEAGEYLRLRVAQSHSVPSRRGRP